MGIIETIKSDIERLSDKDWASLRDWMIERDHQQWDAEIASDLAAGKLDDLIAEAVAARASGKARDL